MTKTPFRRKKGFFVSQDFLSSTKTAQAPGLDKCKKVHESLNQCMLHLYVSEACGMLF